VEFDYSTFHRTDLRWARVLVEVCHTEVIPENGSLIIVEMGKRKIRGFILRRAAVSRSCSIRFLAKP
jgi:hypothetical protein